MLHTLTVTRAGTGSGIVSSAPAGIACGADCTEAYLQGTTVTMTATPAAGSTLVGWTGDAACAGGSVTMDAAHACTATFDQVFHTLTVTRAGTGSGTVSSAPAGIACGADCTEAYLQGTTVTMTATPATGSTLVGWTGDAACAGGSVTMDTAHACTATFDQVFRTLTVTKAGTGSGTVSAAPAGIACGTDCTEAYLQGTTVTMTATPATGSTLVGWAGDAACAGGSVTMDTAHACTATFDQVFRTLTVTKAGTGSGTVSAAPAGIACGADCTEAYLQGTAVTLTATAAADSAFVDWTGAASCPVVTMDTAHTCTATFDLAATPIIWTDLVGAVVNGSTLAKTAPAGWGNGGAASTQFIPADGGIDLGVNETNTYRMIGLSDVNVDASYDSIDYALYFRPDASVEVYEGGAVRGSFGAYSTGDRFQVERHGPTIVYKKNDTTFFTSTIPSAGNLIVDAALYSAGSTATDVFVSGATIDQALHTLTVGVGMSH